MRRVRIRTPDGHIIKLRYTPLQTAVLSVEAPESPHHDALRLFAGLDDTPVVCSELHSQFPRYAPLRTGRRVCWDSAGSRAWST